MSETTTSATSFFDYLESRHVVFNYRMHDFLYRHQGPCPQVSRDHPFGQAPEVLNIPDEEWADWRENVEEYYVSNAVKFGLDASAFSIEHFTESGLVGYAEIDDPAFTETLSEGLYSKFLCPTLDPIDVNRFGPFLTAPDHDQYEYFKSDYSCMLVIEQPWSDEFVAPTVVLLRRPKNGDPYAYQVLCIALAYWDSDKFVWLRAPLTPKDGEAWRLAKYFVLQGAAHRINLIDHTEVHFPEDAINAITKTVLPSSNLVLQLLHPHFRLTLPVNNTVLEGQRSLISRRTWYPWSPFVAKGKEVRKLLPFGWYGSRYAFTEVNSAYPPYQFALAPRALPSRYGAFIAAYHAPIRAFVRNVVEQLPPDDDEHTDWIEIQSWAAQISSWLPGFPAWTQFLARTPTERAQALETLADTLAMVILNAAVVHSGDHATLHKMVNEKPVPFILRVPPPRAPDAKLPIAERTQAIIAEIEQTIENGLRKAIGATLEELVAKAIDSVGSAVAERLTMLCWPTDLIYARMADLLFYRPHNVTLLIDCDYDFPQPSGKKTGPLWDAVAQFQADLRTVAAEQAPFAKQYGFPLLEPPPDAPDDDKPRIAVEECIGAGIQY
jgi:hypothetical protein